MSAGDAVFSGRGNGHGVGMCQWGAKEMAEKGHDFKSILSHYYPGTSLMRLQ
jgi:stage II sporulation protein D